MNKGTTLRFCDRMDNSTMEPKLHETAAAISILHPEVSTLFAALIYGSLRMGRLFCNLKGLILKATANRILVSKPDQ